MPTDHELNVLAAGGLDAEKVWSSRGPEQVLPSVFDVTALATASVAAACLSASALLAARTGRCHVARSPSTATR